VVARSGNVFSTGAMAAKGERAAPGSSLAKVDLAAGNVLNRITVRAPAPTRHNLGLVNDNGVAIGKCGNRFHRDPVPSFDGAFPEKLARRAKFLVGPPIHT
jgi:hypothetical protein